MDIKNKKWTSAIKRLRLMLVSTMLAVGMSDLVQGHSRHCVTAQSAGPSWIPGLHTCPAPAHTTLVYKYS